MTETVVDQRHTVSTTGFSNPLNLPANAEEASHVLVYGDDVLLTLGPDYSLDGVGDMGNLDEIEGVDVIIDSSVLVADAYETFTVVHSPPLSQDADLSSGGRFGLAFENALDGVVRRLQAVGDRVARALHLPVDATDIDTTLPLPEPRRALMWNEAGTAIINSLSDPDTEPLASAAAYAAAAQASAEDAADQVPLAAAQAAIATAQALLAADAADRAETAAAEAGDLTALLGFLWPVGAKLEHFGPTAPTNFLACDGSAVSRTTYSALFAVIGTTYGAGNGTTTFNLPTWNDGRFTRATGGNAAAQGATQTEMIGPHNHPASSSTSGAHTHGVPAGQNVNDGGEFDASSAGAKYYNQTTSSGAHSHTITVGDNDGTENRPRNSSVLVCIKY